VALLAFVALSLASPSPEAPTGFDNQTNGVVDQTTHAADQTEEVPRETRLVSENLCSFEKADQLSGHLNLDAIPE